MKLSEVTLPQVNLKRAALHLQQRLIERIDGFEVTGMEAIKNGAGNPISIKLYIRPAPRELTKKYHVSYTASPHTIEVYGGFGVDLNFYSAQLGGAPATNHLTHGVYMFETVKRGESQLLADPENDLISFVLGLSDDKLELFIDQYVENWGQ